MKKVLGKDLFDLVLDVGFKIVQKAIVESQLFERF